MSLVLSPGAVDLWAIGLSASAPVRQALLDVLAPDERERAARFHFERHRHAYIITHGLLRYLLSAYLGSAPQAFSFSVGTSGKPYLSGVFPAVEFNLSHTEGLVLYAFTSDTPVGVDVEKHQPFPDALELAQRFFATVESAAIEQTIEDERIAGFLRCWTRKEALVKASGDGLSIALDAFNVLPLETSPVRVALPDELLKGPRAWWIHQVDLPPDYVGAVAVPDVNYELHVQHWPTADALVAAMGEHDGGPRSNHARPTPGVAGSRATA